MLEKTNLCSELEIVDDPQVEWWEESMSGASGLLGTWWGLVLHGGYMFYLQKFIEMYNFLYTNVF